MTSSTVHLPALVRWLGGRVQRSVPALLLVLAIIGWCGMWALHLHWRHDRFGSFDHDLGVWDQAVWQLAHGKSFITVRGLDTFGFHVSPALYLYVPFYWLGGGPELLDLSMIIALSLGALAVFRIARLHLQNEWYALIIAVAFLVNYAGQWMLRETFHPEVIAITPLLFAYLAAMEGRWRSLAGWLLFALLWKEDVALAGAMLGVVLIIRGSRSVTGHQAPPGARRVGLWVLGACLLWFVIATRLVIPAFNDGSNFTDALFGDLGGSPTEIVSTAITDPSRVGAHLDRSEPHHYVIDLAAGYGLVPLTAPFLLLLALPQMLINLLASYEFFWSTRLHYAAIPMYAMTLATIEGVAVWRRPGVRRFLVGLVAVGAFHTAVTWGITPVSPQYRHGFWPLTPAPQQAEFEYAVSLPDGDDAVSTIFNIVPHLSHRDEIYTFPNPWITRNWGVAGENRPDPNTVDWLIVNPTLLDDVDFGVLISALADPGKLLEPGEQPDPVPTRDMTSLVDETKWQIVVSRPDLLIVKRIRDATMDSSAGSRRQHDGGED